MEHIHYIGRTVVVGTGITDSARPVGADLPQFFSFMTWKLFSVVNLLRLHSVHAHYGLFSVEDEPGNLR